MKHVTDITSWNRTAYSNDNILYVTDSDIIQDPIDVLCMHIMNISVSSIQCIYTHE